MMRSVFARLVRRAARHPAFRDVIVRTVLREDEIVRFGDGLAFSPRTWVLKETAHGFRIWVALGERSICREILLDRYELDETAFVRANVHAGDRVVDVGANVGYFTALFGALVGAQGHVAAVEPLPSIAEALQRTIDENGFAERTDVHRVALGEEPGARPLRHAPVTANFGGAHFAPEGAASAIHADISVEVTTLDAIASDGRCAFVKVDAEGAEPLVIAGGNTMLRRDRPIVMMEVHPAQLAAVAHRTPTELLAQMRALRYAARRLVPGGTRGPDVERYDATEVATLVFDPLP